MANRLLEKYVQVVREDGLQTNKNVTFGVNGSTPTVTFSGPAVHNGAVTLAGNVTLNTGKTLTVTDTAALTVGGAVVPTLEYVTFGPTQAAGFVSGTPYPIYTFPNDGTTWKVAFVSVRYTTASSSGTVDVGLAASTVAPSSATTQLTGTISTSTTANTVNNGTIIASPTTAAAGAALVITAGGTQTSLANQVVTVALQRLT